MAIWSRRKSDSSQESPQRDHEYGKSEYQTGAEQANYDAGAVTTQVDESTRLHRGLKARHITMIAIGGAIGTGLIIGTGKALNQAGPASILIAYTAVGFLVFIVMASLGEMAAWLPLGSGFSGYATRFCDPALGFALGYTYWFKYIIVTPNQLTASSLVLQEWVPASKVNPGVFIAIFLVIILCINYFGVKFFGEFEFWLSSIKVITIVGVIILSAVVMLGGGPNHDRTGFRYYKKPGAFREQFKKGASGRFLAFWNSLINAVFAYLGTELVGVTVGEAQNPRKTVPRAIKLTFYRILFFYCLSVFLLGMIVPYNSKGLTEALLPKNSGKATASPFVVAFSEAGIKVLPDILNGCVLLFVFSAANSDLYIATRTLYGLASEGHAPKIFARTDKRGVPVFALAGSSCFCLLAFMATTAGSRTVFGYFVNLTTIFGLLTWISILVTHIYWCKARKAQGLVDTAMPYVAPFGIWGSYVALFFCILIALTKNFSVFIHSSSYGKFDYKNFITGYLGIPLYVILIFGYKFYTKEPGVPAHAADFYTGKDIIDREEEEFLAWKAANKKNQAGGKFYKRFISWLF